MSGLVLKPCCAEKNFSSHIVHWFLVSIWRSRQRALQRLNCSVVDLNPADSLNPHLPALTSHKCMTVVYYSISHKFHTSMPIHSIRTCLSPTLHWYIIQVYYSGVLFLYITPVYSLNRHLPRAIGLVPWYQFTQFLTSQCTGVCLDQTYTNGIKMCSVEAANCGVLDWMML